MNEYAVEVERINGNVASTYTALSEMGATMPETQNSDNLPGTVLTVPQGGGTSVQTDWNQADETAPDFLKNKPFSDFPTVVVEEQTAFFEDGVAMVPANNTPAVGTAVKLHLNGTIYTGTVKEGLAGTSIGNEAALGMEDTGEPYFIVWDKGVALIIDLTGALTECSVKMEGTATKVLPDKFYTPQFIFYSPGDGYLYKDGMFTKKVTRTELYNAMLKKPILITRGTTSFYAISFDFTFNDFGAAVCHSFDGTSDPYYTAEYTE